jgi:predicted nuclease of predicted toxin-antitoxin system
LKLLLDQNLSRRLKTSLADIFDEVLHVSELGLDEADDSDIWRLAHNSGWTIMS